MKTCSPTALFSTLWMNFHAKSILYFIALLSSTHLYANVPIESRALSQQQANNVVAGSPSLNWEIMQKNQNFEEEIRVNYAAS